MNPGSQNEQMNGAVYGRNPAPPGMYKPCKNIGISYLSTSAGFQPSTVSLCRGLRCESWYHCPIPFLRKHLGKVFIPPVSLWAKVGSFPKKRCQVSFCKFLFAESQPPGDGPTVLLVEVFKWPYCRTVQTVTPKLFPGWSARSFPVEVKHSVHSDDLDLKKPRFISPYHYSLRKVLVSRLDVSPCIHINPLVIWTFWRSNFPRMQLLATWVGVKKRCLVDILSERLVTQKDCPSKGSKRLVFRNPKICYARTVDLNELRIGSWQMLWYKITALISAAWPRTSLSPSAQRFELCFCA